MDISEAAKLALAVAGGAGCITFWVNSIVVAIDGLAQARRADTERRVAAYDARTRLMERENAGRERETFYERQRAEQAARIAGRATSNANLHPSADELLGKLDAQGRR